MDSKTIAYIVGRHITKLQELGGDITDDPDKETIHDFRLHTKKLRALLRLVSLDHNKHYNLTAKFKALYAVSGEIRDAQLMLDKIKVAEIQELEQWLTEQLEEFCLRWEKQDDDKVTDQLEEKFSDIDYPSVHTNTLETFFRIRIDAIKKIIAAGKFSDETLHDIRKMLKDLQYVAALCKDEWEKGYESILHYDLDKLHELTDRIGAYNDLRNALDWLTRYENEVYIIRDRNAILKMQLHLLEEKLEKKEALVTTLIKSFPAES
ncbi:CHAD domain-containing protein [Chitinophagaceae bacterium MMS25-I14]